MGTGLLRSAETRRGTPERKRLLCKPLDKVVSVTLKFEALAEAKTHRDAGEDLVTMQMWKVAKIYLLEDTYRGFDAHFKQGDVFKLGSWRKLLLSALQKT